MDHGAGAYTTSPRLRVAGSGYVEAGTYYNGDKTTAQRQRELLPRDTLLVEVAYTHNQIRWPGSTPSCT